LAVAPLYEDTRHLRPNWTLLSTGSAPSRQTIALASFGAPSAMPASREASTDPSPLTGPMVKYCSGPKCTSRHCCGRWRRPRNWVGGHGRLHRCEKPP
jgi:hypothetical protein